MKLAIVVARFDLAVWRRSPWAIAAAVIPPLGMYLLVHVLSLAVIQQPVALVVNEGGPQARVVADFIEADTDSYILRVVDGAEARHLLATQQVAAVIEIPKGFDRDVARGRATLRYTLNNVDIDFADDIRRSVDRSVAQFDAPGLGASVQRGGPTGEVVVPNPYRVDLVETDLREVDVPFEAYQSLPVLLLLVICSGVLGGALLGSRDHERGTMRFLRTAPIGRGSFVVGRLLGTAAASGMIVAPVVILLAARGILDPVPGHWPALLALLAETTLLSAGIGVLLGVVFERSSTAALAAVIVASYLFFAGGGFTTIAFLPRWLRVASRLVPTRYAIDAMRQVLFYPGHRDVGLNMAVLGLFTVLVVAGGMLALGRQR